MDLCVAWNGLPFRMPMAITSTLQLAPCQFTLMCSGASYLSAEAFGWGAQGPSDVAAVAGLVIRC